jgi:hypothetical protein
MILNSEYKLYGSSLRNFHCHHNQTRLTATINLLLYLLVSIPSNAGPFLIVMSSVGLFNPEKEQIMVITQNTVQSLSPSYIHKHKNAVKI